MKAIENYRDALKRLIDNKPEIVPKGSQINKDTVALEAGRKRGSIKKSRPENAQLIAEIEAASAAQQERGKPTVSQEAERQKSLRRAAQDNLHSLRADYELALQKNISLIYENLQLKRRIEELEKTKNIVTVKTSKKPTPSPFEK